MVNILLVSHSHKVAEGVYELMKEMKMNDFDFAYIGGIDNGAAFGSNPLEIKEIMEKMLQKRDLLVIADMGSSVMNCQMACEFLDDTQKTRVMMSNGPFFEGTLAAITSNQETTTLLELAKIVADTSVEKF